MQRDFSSEESGGKRSREAIDREIEATLKNDAEANAAVYAEWECTIGDGLEYFPE
jgi:hypothetical protein